MILAPRGAHRIELESLAQSIERAIEEALAPMVIELLREQPRIVVGSARVLGNSLLRPERLTARLVSDAIDNVRNMIERKSHRDRSTLQDVILVSSSAILNSDEGGQMVIVITPDNVAHQHKVSVGVRQGINVELASGVNEGDKVVTVGGLGLDDGSKVVIKEAPPEDDDDQ